MGITKTTTRISIGPRVALAVLTGAVFGFAFLNLFYTLTPQTRMNEQIAARFAAAEKKPFKERLDIISQLRGRQEEALERIPAEPYAWARLSYFRKQAQGDNEAAFEALRMSDMVSPNEPRQMLERALMWRERDKTASDEQKKYQDVLWKKAFYFQPGDTWKVAVEKGLVTEISAALLRTDPEAYGAWQVRIEEEKKQSN